MSATISAVFRDGVFHPDTPPDLPEGTPVSLAVTAAVTAALDPQPVPITGEELLARVRRANSKYDSATDRPEVTSDNHDEVLYGGPGGAR